MKLRADTVKTKERGERWVIWDVEDEDRRIDVYGDDCETMARCLAAAPELLAACEEAEKFADACGDNDSPAAYELRLLLMRAIGKAKYGGY